MSLTLHVCSELSHFKALVMEGEIEAMADMKEAICLQIYLKSSESSAVDQLIIKGYPSSGSVLSPGSERETSDVNTFSGTYLILLAGLLYLHYL